MSKPTRITPTNRRREMMLRLTNDTKWGERLARWLGKVLGLLQFRILKIRPSSDIPWKPLRHPLAEATVAVVTTGGIHLCADKPFDLATDATFREIPRAATNEELCITHEHYDRRDAERDPNLLLPVQRLLELEAEGVIGRVADTHYSFGFTKDPQELIEPGREVGKLLAREQVDLVVLVPA